jgi:hypothetical protein
MGSHSEYQILATLLEEEISGLALQAALWGLHLGIYLFFVWIHRSRGKNPFRGLANTATTVNFVLATGMLITIVWAIYAMLELSSPTMLKLAAAHDVLYQLIDFVTLSLLIHRCWIVWSKNYIIVAIPAALTLINLGCGLAFVVLSFNSVGALLHGLGFATFALSLAVSTMVTAAIIIRIWIISRNFTKDDPHLSRGPYKLVMAMLLESGITVFVMQLLALTLYNREGGVYIAITSATNQIYAFSPTIILIRVALGASYDSETTISRPIDFGNSDVERGHMFTADKISFSPTPAVPNQAKEKIFEIGEGSHY